MRFPIDQRIAYEAESYTDFRSEVELNSFAYDWYVAVPQGSNPRAVALARQMRA